MNKNAKAWLEALRSGEYEKGPGQLKLGDRFCCLGVACDLYTKENKDGVWSENDLFITQSTTIGNFLPNEVIDWLGLDMGQMELTRMNDGSDDYEPKSFKQIADFIEKKYGATK